ncbi:dimethlysulfonioproprionate lyase DddL [Roseinatronobacter bogoriensis subsp. barguzinensis]|uniref:Dimethlysulfonioproprionate lyase DddL n=2 Tax=Roseinatronobacter bogoriensis TaxID=119542 RepID=A0A2K8KCM8_9RHOB|nr:dimethlysulfonioproprionate lyase DddL [Rhodobaca barguzinensis]MBB4209056.1 dimethylpropiothetin dethiomethylase [Rhodobaca bogoriensis DSM 18756]
MDQPAPPLLMTSRPAWVYLLRDFLEMYRMIPAGGSATIRAHQRLVRERISGVLRANPSLRDSDAAHKPVTAHLQRALDQGRGTPMSRVIRSIDGLRDQLSWQYGYEKVPRGLDQKYAYTELVGPTGPVPSDQIILGLVLFAPGCIYPAHAHDGITESYICLSGAMSQNDQGVYVPGSMIFNPPGQMHRITVADLEPSLLAYAWIGPPEKLVSQKMVFSRKTRRPG